jgi:hypothetical protein
MLSLAQDDHALRCLDGRKPVGHHNRCAIVQAQLERRLNLRLGEPSWLGRVVIVSHYRADR